MNGGCNNHNMRLLLYIRRSSEFMCCLCYLDLYLLNQFIFGIHVLISFIKYILNSMLMNKLLHVRKMCITYSDSNPSMRHNTRAALLSNECPQIEPHLPSCLTSTLPVDGDDIVISCNSVLAEIICI